MSADDVDKAVGDLLAVARPTYQTLADTLSAEGSAALTQAQADVAALQAEVDARTAQAERDAATIQADAESMAALQSQHAADQATITQQAARIAQLEAQGDPGLVVGARFNDVPYTVGNAQVGPVKATRYFYGPGEALPPVWVAPAGWPVDTIWIVSYKDINQPNLASFSQSLHAQGGMLTWNHEPEADFATGQAFVTAWTLQRNASKAACPDLPFGMIAGAFQYRPGGFGEKGTFLPPDADFYTIDTYQTGAASGVNKLQPLADDPRFQKWLSLVDPLPGWKGVTEYGRALADTHTYDAQRAALFPVDKAYLESLDFRFFLLWYTSGGASKNWRFTDSASQASWRAVAGG